MKKIPKCGEVISVYDDLKGQERKATVTSQPSEDDVLGTMFEVTIVSDSLKLKREVYWSLFRNAWSIYGMGSGVNVVPGDPVLYDEDNYD